MSKHSRREFLKVGTGAALAGLSAGRVFAGAPDLSAFFAEAQNATDRRAYTAGHFALELDGVAAGWLHSAEGGHATGSAPVEAAGSARLASGQMAAAKGKHIAGVKYEDITVSCGAGMSRNFYEWIKDSLDNKHVRKDGSIHSCDYDSKAASTLEFSHGLITEVGFPALDAASKDAARMTIRISPEVARQAPNPAGAGRCAAPPAAAAQKQKAWLPANFRLKIEGLDCSRVNKIEAITVKQKVVDHPVGELRDYQKEPAKIEIPNLVISVPEEHAETFKTWKQNSMVSTRTIAAGQKKGQLEYLAPDLKESLFTLTFTNMHIFKLSPDKAEAGGENIRRMKAEMYCEDISFSYGSGAWA